MNSIFVGNKTKCKLTFSNLLITTLIILVLFTVVGLMSTLPSTALAISAELTTEKAQVVISQEEAAPDSVIVIPIEIKNIPETVKMAGGEFTLTFDPKVAVPTKLEAGSLLGDFALVENLNNVVQGTARIAFAGSTGVSGDGVICLVTFQVTGEAGTSTPVEISELILNDEMGVEFPVTAEAGKIDVASSELSIDEILRDVLTYIHNQVEDPDVGSISGEWAVLALARAGIEDDDWYDAYRDNLKDYVIEDAHSLDKKTGKVVLHERKYMENERVILALTALGEDAEDFEGYDFVSALTDRQASPNEDKYQALWQGINGAIYALIALDSNDYLSDKPEVRASFLNYLMGQEKTGGGWSLSGSNADPDITGMVLQALAPYYKMSKAAYSDLANAGAPSHNRITGLVQKALDTLSSMQNESGGFRSSISGSSEASESSAQVLTALVSLGYDGTEDMSFMESVLANLLKYRDEATGGFKHVLSKGVDQMATEQAAYALTAYARYLDGANNLYDMSSVFDWSVSYTPTPPTVDKTALRAEIERANRLDESDYTSRSWAAFQTALAAAELVMDSSTATQAKIDNAKAALKSAINALVESGSTPPPVKDDITVKFRLIGATRSDGDIDLGNGDYKDSEYVTWIKTKSYTLDKGSTVYDLFIEALDEAGLKSVGAGRNYVETIYAPSVLGGYKLSEFTNGKRSGWMYTINGKHVGFGLKEQTLKDGDKVIWRYVNDFSYEVADWSGADAKYPSLGDGTYHNKWLKAPDTAPKSGGDDSPGGSSGSTSGTVPGAVTPTPQVPASVWQNDFTDVKTSDWFYEAVQFVVEKDLFKGIDANTFSPNSEMTRAMLVTVLYRLDGSPAVTGTSSFRDVKNDAWYTNAVNWANGQSIVKGMGGGLFGTNDNVTREQLATILNNYAQYKGRDVNKTANLNAFSDASRISVWAQAAMQWANAEELITGRTETTLAPGGSATRAEVATILTRFIKNVMK
ncbi:MAG: S-layer homology domain-containing protein [Dehalobacterium sp.]|jgi:hypothetical protein